MAQWVFVEWLLFWLFDTTNFEFEWDTGNRTKSSSKHGVSTDEVEEVFQLGLALPLGEQVSPKVSERRLGIVGPTATGRVLQVVFTMRAGRVRPISARPAHKRRGNNMARYYAKSLKEYRESSGLDSEGILEAMKRYGGRKRPTSIALDESTIKELKNLSRKLGLPYQVLMRALIIDGLKRLKKAA